MRPLFFLIRLNTRAWLRKITRGVRTFKGIILILIGLGFVTLIILPSFHANNGQIEGSPALFDTNSGAPFRRFGPVGLFAFTLLSLFTTSKYRGIFFRAAEVDMLFPAPFTRRQLLIYRLTYQAIQNAISCLFMSVFLIPYFDNFLRSYIGLFLTFLFLGLAQQATSLIAGSLEERVLALSRKAIGLLLLGVLAIAVAAGFKVASAGGGWSDRFSAAIDNPISQTVLMPFRVFSEMLGAPSASAFLAWGAGALAINVGLLALILFLDVDYREAAIETSRKIHDRLKKMRSGRLTSSVSSKLRWKLPALPRLGGAGPIAWRQAQEMIRESPGTLYLVAIFGFGAFIPLLVIFFGEPLQGKDFGASILPIICISPLILSNWFRFDFRGDIDRLENLKTLPVEPSIIALGQVITPTLILMLLQGIGFMAVYYLSADSMRPWALVGLFLCGPANLLFICIENLFFLLYPIRSVPNTPGDIQNLGRLLLSYALKMLILLAAGLICGGLAAAVYYLCNEAIAPALLTALVLLAGVDILALWQVGWAFRRLDIAKVPGD